MSMTLLITLALHLGPARAGSLWDDAKTLAGDAERAAKELGENAKRTLDDARSDLEKELSGNYQPLSRELAPGEGPSDDVEWIAVLGDSSVTGAAASPRFVVTAARGGQVIGDVARGHADQKLEARVEDFKDPARFNIVAPIEKLTRVFYSRPEFDESHAGVRGVSARFGLGLSQAVDTEEYAFPYLVGRALGVPGARIVLAGQDGRKIAAIDQQLRRLFAVPGVTRLPSLVIASFVANDLCHPDNFDHAVAHFADAYRRDVFDQFDVLARQPAAARGTRVVLLAPLDVAALLTEPRLLDQPVKFENARGATCRAVHDGSAVHGDVAKKLQTGLIGACRGILNPDGDAKVRVAHLRALQIEQLRVLDEAVNAFNGRGLNIRVELARGPRALPFETGDLANDCFHPSVRGHERIATELLRTTFAR